MLVVAPSRKDKSKRDKYNQSIQQALKAAVLQEKVKSELGFFNPRDVRDIAIQALTTAMTRTQKTFCITPDDLVYGFDQCLKRHDPLPVKISQLSAPHLYMLIACSQLAPKFTCKGAFTKYSCFISTQSTSDVFEEPLMTHVFEDLFHENLIVRAKETKLIGIAIAPVEQFVLNVTKSEIERGIQANACTSTVLETFFRSE